MTARAKGVGVWEINSWNLFPLPQCSTSIGNNPMPHKVMYRGADKSLARPTSRCILFDIEYISFDASLVTYINSTNFPLGCAVA